MRNSLLIVFILMIFFKGYGQKIIVYPLKEITVKNYQNFKDIDIKVIVTDKRKLPIDAKIKYDFSELSENITNNVKKVYPRASINPSISRPGYRNSIKIEIEINDFQTTCDSGKCTSYVFFMVYCQYNIIEKTASMTFGKRLKNETISNRYFTNKRILSETYEWVFNEIFRIITEESTDN